MKKILAILSQKTNFEDFAIQELKSLLTFYNLDVYKVLKHEIQNTTPYHEITKKSFARFPFVTLELEDLSVLDKMLARSVTILQFIHIISTGNTYEALFAQKDQDTLDLYKDAEKMRFIIKGFQKSLSKSEQMVILDKFEPLQINGQFCLDNPDKTFYIIEKYEPTDKHQTQKDLDHIYFGVELGAAPRGEQNYLYQLQVSRRIYLGPTTCDAELAFLMANQAQVKPGDWVLDPFAGTCGIYWGAQGFGGEIDSRVLHGMGVGRLNKMSPLYDEYVKAGKKADIWDNFEQYKLPKPEIIKMDIISCQLKGNNRFNAIVTDPPYGFRASARKATKSVSNNEDAHHATEITNCEFLVNRLFDIATEALQKDGLLVFLYPVDKTIQKEGSMFPENPNFKFLDYSECPMSSKKSRYVLTYKKIV